MKVAHGRKGFYGWLGNALEHYSNWVIITTLLLTGAFAVPWLTMAPTELASDNPTGNETVKLFDHIEDTFPHELYWMGFIVEARDGDVLTRPNLYELRTRLRELRQGELRQYLYTSYDETAGTTVEGMYTLADAVDTALRMKSSEQVDLSSESVTDLEIKQIIDFLFENPQTQDLVETLSAQAVRTESGWVSPALIVTGYADDEKVLSDYLEDGDGDPASASTEKKVFARERFARDVQEVMRGEEVENQVWGIAIDLNLEIEDEGEVAGMLLMVAMGLMALLLYIVFRSWVIMLVTVAGLGMLIIWLKGFANVIGLKSSLTLDLIVPITIVVLGVDYAIQALFRYRQEKAKGQPPAPALGNSTYRVGRALVLAMFTTIVAFISNSSSGIESVTGFAFAASFAIFASLGILGLFVPTVIMRWQVWREKRHGWNTPVVDEAYRDRRLSRMVTRLSDRWQITLPIIVVVTGFAAWGWLNVETKFDAEDALNPSSDFVVSLDKWDEHGADIGGEPSIMYFEGDLADPQALEAINNTIEMMDDNEHIGRSPVDNKPNPHVLILELLGKTVTNDYATGLIEKETGIKITDENGDLIPDTRQQLQAVYDYVLSNGLPQDADTLRWNLKQINEWFVKLDSGDYAAIMSIGVPGTREQEIVRLARGELKADLEDGMEGVDSITRYGLTGSGDVRVVQFDAIADSLTSSLLIAGVVVFALLLIVFRSVRYALITIIPVILVACWLYGFMYIAGYSLNMLTATIAAISIGVGIDFSIHFTERFREELGKWGDKREAIRITAGTTGLALFSAALTTAVGFAVIALAPMPIFSTFGILTAIMITLSVLMALFALPSLLNGFIPQNKKPKKRDMV